MQKYWKMHGLNVHVELVCLPSLLVCIYIWYYLDVIPVHSSVLVLNSPKILKNVQVSSFIFVIKKKQRLDPGRDCAGGAPQALALAVTNISYE